MNFKYERGDKYSVIATVTNNETITFSNLIVPPNTPDDVIAKMYEEAEAAVLKKLEGEDDKLQ